MTAREKKLLWILLGVAGAGAYFYYSQSGRSLITSAGTAIQSEVTKLADLTDSTLQLIKRFEGFSAKPYRDARGYSIGYGHYMGASPTIESMTEPEGYDWLRTDVQTASDAVKAAVTVDLTQNQFDALTSLAYNIGVNAFRSSTLVRLLNQGDYTGAQWQFQVWRNSNGQVNPSLVARRAKEAEVFGTA